MDSNQFDRLTKDVAHGTSRRRLLRNLARGAAGVAVAGGVVAADRADAEAKRRVEPPCNSWLCQLLGRCRARNERCTTNAQCCSNRCTIRIVDPKISACE